MKKIIFVFCAIMLVAAGCHRATTPVPATPLPAAEQTSRIIPATSNSSLTEVDGDWNLYHNSQYAFEIKVPKKVNISASACPENPHQELSPINVTEQSERVIIASSKVFTDETCIQTVGNIYPYPGTVGGSTTPYGWVIYISDGIKSVASFNAFVKKSLGPGCKGFSEEKNHFLIEAEGSAQQTMEQISQKCPFIMNKYKAEYNPASGTALFFSLGGQPQFFQPNPAATPYDDEMIASLKYD